MQHKRVALGLTLAAGLAATGLTVATAGGEEPEDASTAHLVASERAEELPGAQRAAWLTDVSEYVEDESARQYAIALYAHHADWKAVREYGAALIAQAEAEAAEAASSSYSSGGGSSLEAIRSCESGGDYGAVSSSGTYRGAYQFDQQTWESVGGSGDPAAAPPAEQDARAQALYDQRGSSPWPTCG